MRIIGSIFLLIFLLNCATREMNKNGQNSLIIGHRGTPEFESENTMGSFKKALKLGADGIELDVVLTRDSQLLVCHDYDLERLCGPKQLSKVLGGKRNDKWNVADYELSELLELHSIPKVADTVYTEENRFVKYETVLSYFKDQLENGNPHLILYTEIKAPKGGFSDGEDKKINNLIYQSLSEASLSSMTKNLWFQSFDEEYMANLSKDQRFSGFQKSQLGLGSDYRLQDFSSSEDFLARVEYLTQERSIQNIHLSKQEILYVESIKKWPFMTYCKKHRIAVDAYTFRDNRFATDYQNDQGISFPTFVNAEEEIKYFSDLGIRALMCDNPTTGLQALGRN